MRRARSKTHSASDQPRPARRVHEEPHDTYGLQGKLCEPTACPTCGVVYREGRWVWEESAPQGAHEAQCPACRRIADRYPAGIVAISGGFARAHREEIEHLVHNLERHEKAEHPLKRCFPIEACEDGLQVATTDARLARGIGRALFHAYRGELDEPAPQTEGVVRVRWSRE